jgi:hypothetical protein
MNRSDWKLLRKGIIVGAFVGLAYLMLGSDAKAEIPYKIADTSNTGEHAFCAYNYGPISGCTNISPKLSMLDPKIKFASMTTNLGVGEFVKVLFAHRATLVRVWQGSSAAYGGISDMTVAGQLVTNWTDGGWVAMNQAGSNTGVAVHLYYADIPVAKSNWVTVYGGIGEPDLVSIDALVTHESIVLPK